MYCPVFSRIFLYRFTRFDNIFTTIQDFVTVLNAPVKERCYHKNPDNSTPKITKRQEFLSLTQEYLGMEKPHKRLVYAVFDGGRGGIRTHVGLHPTRFRVALVMTTSILFRTI